MTPIAARFLALLALASSTTAGASPTEDVCGDLLVSGVHSIRGDLGEAGARLEACRERARRAGDSGEEAELLRLLAVLRGRQDRWQESLRAAEQAVHAARRAGARETEGWTLLALGDARYYLWRFEEAARSFEEASTLFRRLGDRLGESHALKDLAIAQMRLGRRDLAILHLERAMESYPQWRDEELAVSILGNLGTIYSRLGAPRSAERTLERALEITRRRGRADEISDVLGRMASLHLELGRTGEALSEFQEALAAAERAGPATDLPILQGAAAAYERSGDLGAAEAARMRLLAEHRRAGNRIGTCLALTDLASSVEAEDPRRALAMYREAEEVARWDYPECRWEALAGRARIARLRGDRDGAIAALIEALSVVESRRLGLISDYERRALAEKTDPLSRALAALLIERGRALDDGADLAKAFVVLERMRASTLTRAITEARLSRPGEPSGDDLRYLGRLESEVRTLRSRIERIPVDDDDLPELRDRLGRREIELDEHLRNRRRATLERPQADVVTAAEVRAFLPVDTALVSYLTAEDGAYAFIVTAEDFDVVELPTTRDLLVEQVAGFLDLLENRRHAGWTTVGDRLYRDLVAPWADSLAPGIETVVVVPERELRSLPFEALPRDPDARRLLVEDFAVVYTPSATGLVRLGTIRGAVAGGGSAPQGDRSDILVLADPGSPGARDAPARRLRVLYEEEGHDLAPVPFGSVEARRVARYSGPGGLTLTGVDASEARAKAMDLSRFVVLHFATHGLLSARDPRRSALLLSPDLQGREDGFLQAREVELLRLDADLVVLSACRTSRRTRRVGGGPGVETLAEAFFLAGARSVVGTLWAVEDRAAMRLMTSFYRHLADGKSKAEALRSAKLEAVARGDPPFRWAGFILLVEPLGRVAVARPWGRRGLSTLGWILVTLLLAGALVASGLYGPRIVATVAAAAARGSAAR
jgi:CHAT domain-containing protein/tetratricopeptide (TPR) repeat protein